MDYKFDWAIFNQNWEPWYGMFDNGDKKNFYQDGKFFNWINNEPAVDLCTGFNLCELEIKNILNLGRL